MKLSVIIFVVCLIYVSIKDSSGQSNIPTHPEVVFDFDIFFTTSIRWRGHVKGLVMIFAGRENPLIIFKSNERYRIMKQNK